LSVTLFVVLFRRIVTFVCQKFCSQNRSSHVIFLIILHRSCRLLPRIAGHRWSVYPRTRAGSLLLMSF
ncbi:MAG: hypothetical protein H7707_06975, partial [Acetobacter sp.]|nr:hypothetical protein [Acetobacter sp.]